MIRVRANAVTIDFGLEMPASQEEGEVNIYVQVAIGLALAATNSMAARPLFENSNFQQGTLKNWTVEGQAFEHGPTTGAVVPQSDVTGSVKGGLARNWRSSEELYRQPKLEGYEGKAFANSYHPLRLDRTTGVLTSTPFVIEPSHAWHASRQKQARVGVLRRRRRSRCEAYQVPSPGIDVEKTMKLKLKTTTSSTIRRLRGRQTAPAQFSSAQWLHPPHRLLLFAAFATFCSNQRNHPPAFCNRGCMAVYP